MTAEIHVPESESWRRETVELFEPRRCGLYLVDGLPVRIVKRLPEPTLRDRVAFVTD